MKLSENADARARLRMLRAWVTPAQYREIYEGLQQVEAPPRGALRKRIAVRVGEARKTVVAAWSALVGMPGRANPAREP